MLKIIEAEALTLEELINTKFRTPCTWSVDLYFVLNNEWKFEYYCVYDGEKKGLFTSLEEILEYVKTLK